MPVTISLNQLLRYRKQYCQSFARNYSHYIACLMLGFFFKLLLSQSMEHFTPINQGPSKHQDKGFMSVTKIIKLFLVFRDHLGAQKMSIRSDMFHVGDMKN